jgi:hypothetical protein
MSSLSFNSALNEKPDQNTPPPPPTPQPRPRPAWNRQLLTFFPPKYLCNLDNFNSSLYISFKISNTLSIILSRNVSSTVFVLSEIPFEHFSYKEIYRLGKLVEISNIFNLCFDEMLAKKGIPHSANGLNRISCRIWCKMKLFLLHICFCVKR